MLCQWEPRPSSSDTAKFDADVVKRDNELSFGTFTNLLLHSNFLTFLRSREVGAEGKPDVCRSACFTGGRLVRAESINLNFKIINPEWFAY